MLVSESGDVLGSLSGGCIEGAVVAAALEVIDDGGARRESFGYSPEDAFAVGLTCGGELEIHIELLADAFGDRRTVGLPVLEALTRVDTVDPGAGVALIRRVDVRRPDGRLPEGAGAVVISDPAGFELGQSGAMAALLGVPADADPALLLAAAAQLTPMLRNGTTGVVRLAAESGCFGDAGAGAPAVEPVTLLVESRLPPPRLLVFGANDFGAALVPAARLLGYHVTLCDARPAFARQERFALADHVAIDWPHRYLAAEAAAGRLDARTVVCVLTHDPKFDIPLLETALRLDLAYVGAMGSRRSHGQRLQSLLAAGVPPEEAGRLHSPIGLDIGAVTPAEVAVSITAEIVAGRTRSARGLSLKDGTGPIHQQAGTAVAPLDRAPHCSTLQRAIPQDRIPHRSTPQHQEMSWT
jgi:xanthine dehydrogenase accessory factor